MRAAWADGGPTLTGYLRAWVAGLVGFLVGEYGAGAYLTSVQASRGTEAVVELAWLPWILAPVLGAIAGASVLRLTRGLQWWHWLVAVLVVPIGAGMVSATVVAMVGADAATLPVAVLVQVLVAGALGLGIGLLRQRMWTPPAAAQGPLTYTTPIREDDLA